MDKIIKVKINKDNSERRVKDILRSETELSSGLVKKLKKTEDGIVLNGERVNTDKIVLAGDELVITIHDDVSYNIVPTDISISIIFEDEDIIVLNKPRNLPTHPSLNHYEDTLANGLMRYFEGENFTFRAITRLDRDTSGIVLVAKNPYSAQILGNDMKNKKISKEYIAVVNGIPLKERGVISAPIKRKEESVVLRCVADDGKEAVTEYEVEKVSEKYSLVRLIPYTGRTHQLRVHMSYIGNPIYGDDLYGAPQVNEAIRLHCKCLKFIHPITKKGISVEADIPDDMTNFF